MNFQEIKEKNPKAFALLLKETTDYEIMDGEYVHTDNLRSLYGFFDEQGIIIMIWHRASGVVCVNADMWNFKIDQKNGLILKDGRIGPQYHTRPEAESAAFTKAFKLLEKQS